MWKEMKKKKKKKKKKKRRRESVEGMACKRPALWVLDTVLGNNILDRTYCCSVLISGFSLLEVCPSSYWIPISFCHVFDPMYSITSKRCFVFTKCKVPMLI